MPHGNIHVVVTMRTAVVSDNVVETFNHKIAEKARHRGFKCLTVYKNNTNAHMTSGRSIEFKGRCENAFEEALLCGSHTPCVVVINGNNGNAMERQEWMNVLRAKISYSHCASITFCVMSPNAYDASIAINERAKYSATRKNQSHHVIQAQMNAQQESFTAVQREELPFSFPIAKTINIKFVRLPKCMDDKVTDHSMNQVYQAISLGESSHTHHHLHVPAPRYSSKPWEHQYHGDTIRHVPISWDM
jgi:hypothetical protein